MPQHFRLCVAYYVSMYMSRNVFHIIIIIINFYIYSIYIYFIVKLAYIKYFKETNINRKYSNCTILEICYYLMSQTDTRSIVAKREAREPHISETNLVGKTNCCQKCITPRNAITHVTCILPLLLHYMSMIRLVISAEMAI